jgi:predicted SprT family Zn-dependent metalloprotease
MVSRWPKRPRFNKSGVMLGAPKYVKGDEIGDFSIIMYQGHSYVNKRNAHLMSKAQHWYQCKCKCGNIESRSQQELIDTRRQQRCKTCRGHLTLSNRNT